MKTYTQPAALADIAKWKPAWSVNGAATVAFAFQPLRPVPQGIALDDLLRYLLAWLSRYGGLGAKVRQGWGAFTLADDPDWSEIERRGRSALQELIAHYPYTRPGGQPALPKASEAFAATWIIPGPASPEESYLAFTWPQGQPLTNQPWYATGYALNYRLRRTLKFYRVKGGQDWPTSVDKAAWQQARGGIGIPLDGHANHPWSNELPFVRALFGRDNAADDEKHAGLLGTTHAHRLLDGRYAVRFFGVLPQGEFHFRLERDEPRRLSWNAAEVREFVIAQMGTLLHEATGVAPAPTQLLIGGNLT